MQSICSPEDDLILIDDAPLSSLRKAYWELGRLQHTETKLQMTLKKHLKDTMGGLVWHAKMEESQERLDKIRAASSQVRNIVNKKEHLRDAEPCIRGCSDS
jgi:hypothetical protein